MSARTPLIRRSARLGLVAFLVVPLAAAALGLGAGIAAVVGSAEPAAAQCGPRLAVSKTAGLDAGGELLTVSGSCFDVNKGIYVAFCVVPPAGAAPSPCGGGVDMSGAGGLSHWISSNPPPNGVGLAVPYGPGGSFSVTMRPSAQLNATVDCRRVSCAIVTRNDHTRSTDRSQDVIVPVTFAAPAPPPTAAPAPPPPTAPPTTAAPETTTTTVPETTTTTTTAATDDTAIALVAPDGSDEGDGGDEELAAETASSESSSSSAGIVVAVIVLVVLAAAVGGGWFALRHRGGGAGGAGGVA